MHLSSEYAREVRVHTPESDMNNCKYNKKITLWQSYQFVLVTEQINFNKLNVGFYDIVNDINY